MANPGQPILDASGKPCLTPTGKPIVADAGGSASCTCGVCPSYYRADYCSPGDCSLVTYVYFCSTWQAGCCHSGGCGGTTTRAIQIGDVVQYGGRCFRVNSLTLYTPGSLPTGAIVLTGSVSEGSSVCMGPPWFACSDCREINGYVNCDISCACIGSQGGGGLPPGGIYISCAELRRVLRDCPYCPIWPVEWPVGSGKWFCVMPNYDAPTQPFLPDGAVEVAGCGASTCCECCSVWSSAIGNPTCCSCNALGPTGCRSTTYRAGLSPTVTPYGCCWKYGTWRASGGGFREDYYAGFPTYPFRTITAEASGQEVVTTYREYDTVTGALLNTYSYTDPVSVSACGFTPQSDIMTNSFPGGGTGNSGTMIVQCDLLKWDYVNNNWPTGGVKTISRGSIVITGDPGACNGNPCQSLAFGESGTGCADCVTLSLGVSVEDLEALA